jgi:hypothetical protein
MLAPRQCFSISSLAALREVSSIKPKPNMTKTQAEVVLASFVARGWLHKSRCVCRLSTPNRLRVLTCLWKVADAIRFQRAP